MTVNKRNVCQEVLLYFFVSLFAVGFLEVVFGHNLFKNCFVVFGFLLFKFFWGEFPEKFCKWCKKSIFLEFHRCFQQN